MVAPLAPYADLDAFTIDLLRSDRIRELDRGPTALQRQSLAVLRAGRGIDPK